MKKAKREKLNETERTASSVSYSSDKAWYICNKDGRRPVIVSEENIWRYMQLGFKVDSAFFKGEKYRNLYRLDGKIQFVM